MTALISSAPACKATATFSAAASCDQADQFLVAWQSLVSGVQDNIYARFIGGDGALGTVHQISPHPFNQRAPSITCNHNGQLYLVAWEQQYSTVTGPYGIRGRMISSEKRLGDAFTLVTPTAGVQAEFTRPATAGGRAQFLTAWEHDRANTTYQDIHARIATPFAFYLPIAMR